MLETVLSTIDLFGIPVIINFSGREKIKSRFGGICSLLFFAFAAWALYNASKDLFSTSNPKTVTSEIFQDPPREVALTPDTFPMAFSILSMIGTNYEFFADPSVYTLKMTLGTLRRTTSSDNKAIEQWTYADVKLERCKPEHFGTLRDRFISAKSNNLFCISLEQPELDYVHLQGAFMSSMYKAIRLEVYKCINGTFNHTCASPEKIAKYLDGAYFAMVYPGMVIDPTNYTHPDARYQEIYSFTISPSMMKTSTVNLANVQVVTDKGRITEDNEVHNYIQFQKSIEGAQNRGLEDHSMPLVRVQYESSKLETVYTRSYKKLSTVLAEAAGLANTALIVLIILTSHFMKVKFREALINEFYDIDLNNNRRGRRRYTIDSTRKPSLAKSSTMFSRDIETKKTMPEEKLTDIQIPSQNNQKDGARGKSFGSPESKKEILKSSSLMNNNKQEGLAVANNKSAGLEQLTINSMSSLGKENAGLEGSKNTLNQLVIDKEQSMKLEKKVLEENENENEICEESILQKGKSEPKVIDFGRQTSDNEEKNLYSTTPQGNDHCQIEFPNNTSSPQHHQQTPDKPDKPEKPKKINIGIYEYLSFFIYRPKSIKEKLDTLEVGIKSINQRLDVMNILKKMREVDKLRALLFDRDQLMLFNNLPKPTLRPMKGEQKLVKDMSYSHEALRKPFMLDKVGTEEDVMESYDRLKNKKDRTELDEKLLEIFNEAFEDE